MVGQRVCLSPTNHPVADICDELKGEYPKDFKFVGWHPHCRCYVESILKSDKELKEDTRRIIRGEQPTDSAASTNAVTETPPNDTLAAMPPRYKARGTHGASTA